MVGFIGNMYHMAHLVGHLLCSEVVKSNGRVTSTGSRFWKCYAYVLSLWSANMFNNCLRSCTSSRDQDARLSHSIKITNSSFEMVENIWEHP